ncbi:unnamed protein product [Didymodactylos carnosus]|uniref:CHAT domain-containing protein n=2 Tax=Didymodactylos carnosus TaxID=1234261 RepID=A0A8S2F0G4_9BILA|nr:unnamed protein product [Didymodactylos carnosus]CAF4128501.1 unnamed protein product [Didymodactylos carnosus]
MAYKQLSELVYIGNPMFKTQFWLQIAKLKFSENKMHEFISCLAVIDYAILNYDNVLQICDYYLLRAKAHLYEYDYDNFVEYREKNDKLLTETLFKNDYSSGIASVFQYKTTIAAWYDEYEVLCINFANQLQHKHLNLQDNELSEKLIREAFRTADWRIMRGYVTEEMILANWFELQIKTVKIPENCAYLTFKINGFYSKGKMDCLILASGFSDLVRTDLVLDEDNVLTRLASVFKDVGKEHTFEQNIDQIKNEYPVIYKDFLAPVELLLKDHSIFNLKIVSNNDFYRKVLGQQQTKQLSEKDLIIPREHCRHNVKFTLIDLKKHNLQVNEFLENITFMAEGFNQEQNEYSICESDMENQNAIIEKYIIKKLEDEKFPFTAHPKATKEEVESFLKDRINSKSCIFHYAGHTFYDEEQIQSNYALSGCVILEYENGNDCLDTKFYSNQIANYDLRNIHLAVLNSCSTLKGSSLTRSGHLGLTRGFIIAGVSTVAATLMDLDTNVSLEFANRFYKCLQKGLTISCSFTRTIRDLKKLDDYTSPDSWGPFISFGSEFKTLNIVRDS